MHIISTMDSCKTELRHATLTNICARLTPAQSCNETPVEQRHGSDVMVDKKKSHSELVTMLDSPTMITILAGVLDSILERNDMLPLPDASSSNLSRFSAAKPSISVLGYLQRILKYAPCSAECFVMALIYMDRLIQSQRKFRLTSLNVHRLLITTVMVAAKFLDDCYYNNAYYAKVGGISLRELNLLELDFVFTMNFSLDISRHEFDTYNGELVHNVQRNASSQQLKQAQQHMSPYSSVQMHTPPSTPDRGVAPVSSWSSNSYSVIPCTDAAMPSSTTLPCWKSVTTLPSPPTTPSVKVPTNGIFGSNNSNNGGNNDFVSSSMNIVTPSRYPVVLQGHTQHPQQQRLRSQIPLCDSFGTVHHYVGASPMQERRRRPLQSLASCSNGAVGKATRWHAGMTDTSLFSRCHTTADPALLMRWQAATAIATATPSQPPVSMPIGNHHVHMMPFVHTGPRSSLHPQWR